MLQLLQFYVLERDLHADVPQPVFEPIATGRTITWKYRGQVVPTNETIETTAQIVSVGRDERGVFVRADASLWVDGKQIYRAASIGMRIVEAKPTFDIAPLMNREFSVSITPNTTAGGMPFTYDSRTA